MQHCRIFYEIFFWIIFLSIVLILGFSSIKKADFLKRIRKPADFFSLWKDFFHILRKFDREAWAFPLAETAFRIPQKHQDFFVLQNILRDLCNFRLFRVKILFQVPCTENKAHRFPGRLHNGCRMLPPVQNRFFRRNRCFRKRKSSGLPDRFSKRLKSNLFKIS